jgi:ATP-dependent helicase HrpB
MDASWLKGQKILMLEPRRLAATAIASRIAQLLGEQAGQRAGFRVRTATRVSRETRIEVLTEALLTRMIQRDPLLSGVGVVIIDEFHERSIHADLALALALEVRRARSDLAILVMSATLETEGVSRLLEPGNKAPSAVMRCPGKSFPVQTLYQPLSAGKGWEDGFADGLAKMFDSTEGDILAFVPGSGEIRRVGGRLGGLLSRRAEVLGLHGLLPLSEQRRIAERGASGPAVEDSGLRRVIVSTSIAETSLTVPGVRAVCDSGWSRLSRFHPATGLDRLVTERVSRSSADQRQGRAGRLGPGLCVRFWSESEKIALRSDPEILRSDLSGLVLECALWGAREPGALAWMDAPSAVAWTQAWEILRMLDLVNDDGPTDLGRRVVGFGLPPRLGVLVARGAEGGSPVLAATCAALLEERDASGLTRDPDLRLRLELLRSTAEHRGQLDFWRRSVMTETERILRRVGVRGAGMSWTAVDEARVGNLLSYAFPDRIARRAPDKSYNFVTGRMARLPGMGVSRAATPWICAPDADPGETAGLIRLAAPVDSGVVEVVLAEAAQEMHEVRWEGLVPRGFLVRRAGRLLLSERPLKLSEQEVADSFHALLARHGVSALPWNESSRAFLARMRFFASARPEMGLGNLSDTGLAESAALWLDPFLKLTGGQVLTSERLRSALQGILGAAAEKLRAEVPESITLPAGGKRKIDYGADGPAVEARIQEVFGLSESPHICGVPLIFHLLSPARRPLQVTRDLAGFWQGTYAEVRKEMRGRYPKHYWPEDPLHAQPTTGLRPGR